MSRVYGIEGRVLLVGGGCRCGGGLDILSDSVVANGRWCTSCNMVGFVIL